VVADGGTVVVLSIVIGTVVVGGVGIIGVCVRVIFFVVAVVVAVSADVDVEVSGVEGVVVCRTPTQQPITKTTTSPHSRQPQPYTATTTVL